MVEMSSIFAREAQFMRKDPFAVEESDTLRHCLENIEKANGRAVLVSGGDRICSGVIAEGDIRRALIRGIGLDEPVHGLLKNFFSVDSSTNADQAAHMLSEKDIDVLPVISAGGALEGIWTIGPQPTTELPVFVLAGGKGTRLRPLTLKKPKPLIEVGGETLLDRTIRRCVSHGFRNFYISVNYLKEQVIDHLNSSSFEFSFSVVEEESPLGTAGPLALLPKSEKRNILVVNADVIHEVNLRDLVKQHDQDNGDITVAIRLHELTVPFGVVNVLDSRVVSVDEKPTFSFPVSTGIYVLSHRARQLVTPGQPLDMPELIRLAIDRGLRVGAFATEDYWLDVGTPETLAIAEKDLGSR